MEDLEADEEMNPLQTEHGSGTLGPGFMIELGMYTVQQVFLDRKKEKVILRVKIEIE